MDESPRASAAQMRSAVEHMRSIDEELERSREKLQLANEELTTANEDVADRNTELNRLNGDLVNLQTSTRLAIVLLNRDLTIRRFSEQAAIHFDLAAHDVGRPIGRLTHHLVSLDAANPAATNENGNPIPPTRRNGDQPAASQADAQAPASATDLEAFIARVVSEEREREIETRDAHGRWYSLRVRPYITLDGKVDGAVLVLIDIDTLKRTEQGIAAARDHANAIVQTARDPLLILNADLRVESANEAFYSTFKVSSAQSAGRLIFDLGDGQWQIPQLRQLLEEILSRNSIFNDFEITHDFGAIGTRTMLLNARTLRETSEQSAKILLGIQDVTELLHFQAAARRSQTRYQALVEASAQIVWTTDADGAAVEDSPSWRAFTGQSHEQRKGLGWLGAIHTDDRERVASNWRRTVEERTLLDIECRIAHVSGQLRWAAVRLVPVLDHQGAVREWVGMSNDITELKRVQEETRKAGERFHLIAESMPQKIFTAKPDGDADYFNPQWLDFSGLTFEQIKERGWTQHIHPDEIDQNLAAWRHSIETGQPFHFEHRVRRADGEYRWHITRAVALKDAIGNTLMWLGSSTDIHEVKEADDRKNEFLAMLAHELRNPLAPIRYMVEIMKRAEGRGELIPPALETMERQLAQMTRLIDDLLDVSRVSRGKLQLRREAIELASVVHHVVEATRSAMECARHELTVTLPKLPIYLHADPVRLTQVLGNLLNNACKFTPPGGRISLVAERQGGDVVITMTDSGIGIAPDLLPKIFDMFTQGDHSLERSLGGLGIGLTLVERLVRMHGGSVKAYSEGLGRGSRFVLRLPALIDGPKHLEPLLAGGEAAAVTAHRILVVDDNHDAANSLALLLTMTGHETRIAFDGLEAVEAAAAFKPDAVLLDIGLPKLNGYDAARRIRQQHAGNGIVLIALTGWGQDEDRKKTADAGFNAHLVKPVDYATLMHLLADLPIAAAPAEEAAPAIA